MNVHRICNHHILRTTLLLQRLINYHDYDVLKLTRSITDLNGMMLTDFKSYPHKVADPGFPRGRQTRGGAANLLDLYLA